MADKDDKDKGGPDDIMDVAEVSALIFLSDSVQKNWRYPEKLVELIESRAKGLGVKASMIPKLLCWLWLRGEIDVDLRDIIKRNGLA